MFEPRRAPLISRAAFFLRIARAAALAGMLIFGSLAIGVIGYHFSAGLSWIDSLLNASMILTGMGPVDVLRSNASKLFASAYALFSGVAFLTIVAVVLAPVFHRFLHRFHLELADESDDRRRPRPPRGPS